MLPNPNGQPPRLCQQPVGVDIAFPIALNLWSPIFGVCARRLGVQRAAVPETSIDEDDDALRWKHDIRSSFGYAARGAVDAVTKAHGVERSTQDEFGLGVPLPIRLHGSAN